MYRYMRSIYELINPFIRITHARDITLSGSQTFQTSKITVYTLTTHTFAYTYVVYIIIRTHYIIRCGYDGKYTQTDESRL